MALTRFTVTYEIDVDVDKWRERQVWRAPTDRDQAKREIESDLVSWSTEFAFAPSGKWRDVDAKVITATVTSTAE